MAFQTFNDVMVERCNEQPDRACLIFDGKTFSYAEVHAATAYIAGGLYAAGVRHGIKVAILVENKPEIILLYLALAKLGAVSVPLNTAAKGELLAYYLEKSDAEYAVCDSDYLERLETVLKRSGIRQIFEISETEIATTSRLGDVPVQAFSVLAKHAPLSDDNAGAVTPTDTYILLFTSGTTGPSKAIIGTHHYALTIGRIMAEAYEYGPEDVLYVCVPLFHGNGWQCAAVPALIAGAAIAISRRFSVSSFWKEVRVTGATQFNIMSSMTNFLWSQAPSAAEREHKVRQCMLVPTPAAFYDEFKQRFNIKAIQSLFALTDVGVVTISHWNDPPEKRLSAGRADDRFDVQIFGDKDVALPAGKTGEIVVRNREPWIMPKGYYKDPERTVGAWQNLWFHTGDRGYFDADGYLYFVDRKKDAIRRRGENISSYEVEQLVLAHQGVKDVAAYPVPSKESEDEVAVSVVRREGHALSELELIEHCRANMPYYMVPRYIEFLDKLPLTATGKVEKYKLSTHFNDRADRIWDREQHGIKITRRD